jgi:zinc/manganese transport system permease protein
MMEFASFMAAPIAMCLVLVGIHVYLGLHVIRRGIIFVDIALAQCSALGAAVGLAMGIELGTPMSKNLGLGAAIVASWLISVTRTRAGKVPQEAFIGICYVVATAGTVLLLTGVPHGGEEIRNLLVGSILWVRWTDVLQSAGIYAAIGVFHYVFRRHFWRVTENPDEARRSGLRVGWWDFLFYASLGVVVTQSVQVAGVLLVFTFLVVPGAMAVLALGFGSRTHLLALGWLLGAIIASAGAALSYALDLPTGATIVCAFGIALIAQVALRGRREAA